MASVNSPIGMAQQQRRAFWLKHLHQWHWISAGLSLVGLLLFSLTGITLNHARQIEADPQVRTVQIQLPAELQPVLVEAARQPVPTLPEPVRHWLGEELGARLVEAEAEWSEDELYLSLPQPGGDGWLSIDFASGKVEHEHTDRGWVSYLNDLHKGRHAGPAWGWFIDLFAVACAVFALTGLLLLQLHARRRPLTRPIVVLGALLPLLVLLIWVH